MDIKLFRSDTRPSQENSIGDGVVAPWETSMWGHDLNFSCSPVEFGSFNGHNSHLPRRSVSLFGLLLLENPHSYISRCSNPVREWYQSLKVDELGKNYPSNGWNSPTFGCMAGSLLGQLCFSVGLKLFPLSESSGVDGMQCSIVSLPYYLIELRSHLSKSEV